MSHLVSPPAALAALALVSACQAKSAANSEQASIAGREWSLVELEGQPLDSAARAKPPTLTLASEGTRASGFAGCNRFAGTYTLGAGTLEFGPLVMTRMACPDMDIESRYSAVLSRVRQYRVEGGKLLLSAGGTTVAQFAGAPAPAPPR